MIFGVIGDAFCSPEIAKIAEEVGENIAKKGAILICGGLGGVMEAVCRGAKKYNGVTVGVLPGFRKKEANPYIDIPIVTGMDQGRNIIIIRSSDVVIAIGGGYGTLSEIAFSLKLNIPIIGIKTWELKKEGKETKDIIRVETAQEAVEKAWEFAKKFEK
jgi:uncharacterized protein (TIGR00725 family)